MSGPPDKYIALPRTGSLAELLTEVNQAADEGYRIEAVTDTEVWMGNYKGSGS